VNQVTLGGTRLRDFGGIVEGTSLGMARPTTQSDLVGLVESARREGTRLTLRGRGSSQSGQSVPDESLLVQLTGLSQVAAPSSSTKTVYCEAGVTFRALTQRCLQAGWIPRVLPLILDLTVGGVLSAGGFGSNSHRWGPIVSQVRGADVVLGTGQLVRTGPNENRPVYDAVFGGVGRCGIIAGVELAIEPAPPCIRTLYLLYDSLPKLLSDAQKLQPQADHLEAFCSASIQGLCRAPHGGRKPLVHWLYGLHVSLGCQHPEAAAEDGVLKGLQFKKLLHDDHDDCAGFAARYDVRFKAMQDSGTWHQAHPWFEAILPLQAAEQFIGRALELLPPYFGDGHRILVHSEVDRPRALAFPAHPAAGFAVLPQGIAPPLVAKSLEVLAELDRLLREVGGKRYLSGYLFDMDRAAWQAHYEADYEALVSAQREFDPAGVFGSRLAPL
jgi:cytokinin dehydrogenase